MLLLLVASVSSNAASAPLTQQQLLEEAAHKTALAEQYRQAADKINSNFHIGTAFNEIDANEHKCYVVGKLLGKDQQVKHLEKKYPVNPAGRSDENAQALRVIAQSYENFSYQVEAHIRESEAQLKHIWNLDCQGKLGIPSGMEGQASQTTFYRYDREGRAIYILGDIKDGFANRVIAAVNGHPDIKIVALGSGGGSVREAILAGLFIRSRRLDTVLWNGCYSACPMVFVAGINRSIYSPYPVIGFHQIADGIGNAIPLRDSTYVELNRYLTAMGIDAQFFITSMYKARPEQMNEVAGHNDVLCQSNIATWIQRVCSSADFSYSETRR